MVEQSNKDEIICNITNDIIKDNITTFNELIDLVKKKYGDIGVIMVSVKTSFFKELLNSNLSSSVRY